MPLTEAKIKTSKPLDKDYKLFDEKSLYLLVKVNGNKLFRFDYRYANKYRTMSFGAYPEITLKEARDKRDEARKLLRDNIDPMEHKKSAKQQLLDEHKNSFQLVATEYFDKNKQKWDEKHANRKWHFLEKDVFPILGKKPINNITAKELLTLFENIQKRGAIDVAHRIKGICGEILRYGIYTGKCERDYTQDLKGALIPKRNKHMATITNPINVGELLRAIENYSGDIVTKCALKLTPYVMLRPGELRQAEWNEINLELKQWKIPASKMKMRRDHIIPLSTQSISILKEIQGLTGQWKYVFPSKLSKERPMSNNTINTALRRMDYDKEEMTAHGFRAMASTLLHEKGYDSAIIEMQLAHAERNKVKASYNHAEYLDKRIVMMQEWADYLDKLKRGN